MQRRSFLGSMLAACAAPAIIVRPGVLMPVVPLKAPEGMVIEGTIYLFGPTTLQIFTREAFEVLEHNLDWATTINREHLSENFTGNRIKIRRPQRYA